MPASYRYLFIRVLLPGWFGLVLVFEGPDVAVGKRERDDPDYSERHVCRHPEGGDAAQRGEDQGVRDHEKAGDHAGLDGPFVACWVADGSRERQCDDQVAEGEPVRGV